MKTLKNKAKERRLREAVTANSDALMEATALLGRGVHAHYEARFKHYSSALAALVAYTCSMHVADWDWDGYEGHFTFRWDFGTQLSKPSKPAYDTRFFTLSTRAYLDDGVPLDEELARLQADAAYCEELRRAVTKWATNTAKESK
jgi:hypothetical protein